MTEGDKWQLCAPRERMSPFCVVAMAPLEWGYLPASVRHAKLFCHRYRVRIWWKIKRGRKERWAADLLIGSERRMRNTSVPLRKKKNCVCVLLCVCT